VAIKAAGQEDKEPKRVPAAKAKPVVSEVKPVKDNHQSDEPSRVEPVKEKSSVAVPNQTVVKSDNAPRVSGSHVEDAPKPRNTRKIVTRVLASIVGLIVIVIVVFGVLIYGYRSESSAVKAVSAVVPYPAMRVGNDFVSYHEYLFELGSIKQYYQSQAAANGQTAVDFNSSQGKTQLAQLRSQIITQLKSDEVTRQLIASNNITVTKKELDDQFNQLKSSAGGDAKLKEVLTKVYGWDENDLRNKLKFQLASQKLQTKITSDSAADAAAKAKAQDIYAQIQAGGDFATLAKKYSQDTTAANGGDLGFFSKGQMVKAFETVAFAQQPGQVSEPVKTQYGYHIIKTIEFNADKTQVHAAHILIKTIDFTSYLSNKVKATKSTVYIKQ
jgi:foldase protein PrsA